METVRGLLNRLRWDLRAAPDGVVVEARSREAGVERIAEIEFGAIEEILAGGVTVAGGVFLPYHRIVRVRRGGEVLWTTGQR